MVDWWGYKFKVKRCVSQLQLIAKGDVAGARKLDPVASNKKKKKDSYSVSVSEYPEDSEGSHTTCSTVHLSHADRNYDYSQQQKWTSLQFTEAMSILNKFLKLKFTKCNRCMAKSPILKKPTFGWLHMVYLLNSFFLCFFFFLDVYNCKKLGSIFCYYGS